MNTMRKDFAKELLNLREQVLSKKKEKEDFTGVEARYFREEEGIPSEYVEVFNQRLSEMQETFNEHIKEQSIRVRRMNQQIEVVDRLNAEGVRFRDMNMQSLVARLGELDEPALDLWRAIHTQIGSEYFFDAVQQEYCLTL